MGIPLVPLESSTPIETEPFKPTTQIFVPEGISAITHRPYSGTIIRREMIIFVTILVTDFQYFELPTWSVTYRYEAYLEVLITNSGETLCSRYSGVGYAKHQYLWSDVIAAY